ncbi:MAG: hypothetical protein IJ565_01430 [Bacilli bacterium]|nr:hypothetical protein [Bacilli bacterium]
MAINIKKENDIIIYEIEKAANTYEVEMARKGIEKRNQMLGLIRDGDDLFTCSYPVQTMYEINLNNNHYTISNSDDITKLRTLEIIDDLMYEYIITIDYKDKQYYVLKYIHNLNHSTIGVMSYSNVDGGNLSLDEAKEIIISTLDKIKNLNDYDKYIDMDKLVLFFKELNVYESYHQR